MTVSNDTVIIEFNGKRYIPDDGTHTVNIYTDDTPGAELEVFKEGVGAFCVNLKEI